MPPGKYTRTPEMREAFKKLMAKRGAWNKGKKTGIVPAKCFKKGNIPWNKIENKPADYKKNWLKNRDLKKNYGITSEVYNAMRMEQDCRCAICGKHEIENKTRLGVDHCHITKRIRGLLCHSCNLAIGMLKDDVNILTNAIAYLRGN